MRSTQRTPSCHTVTLGTLFHRCCLDFVGILPIYAARERAMAGVDSAMLAARIPGAQLVPYDRGAEWLASQPATVVATVGAGDIDRLVPHVERLIRGES